MVIPKFGFRLAILFMLIAMVSVNGLSAQEETVDCPTDNFIDVQPAEGNEAYPDPELAVSCTNDTMVIESNGIPNFEFMQITPNDLAVQEFVWEIPLNPIMADEPTDIPLLGAIGIAVNGLPINGPNESANGGYSDPYLDGILDFCNGHVGGGNEYHLHAVPSCIFEEYEGSVGLVVGYAFDGFPILAPYICTDTNCTETIELTSSWQRTSDVTSAWEAHEYIEGSGDLDQCNGMVMADGSYAYIATQTFPYILGCYVGEVDANLSEQGGPPPGGGGQGGPPPGGDGNSEGGPPPGGDGGQGGPPPGGDGNGEGGPPPGN